MAGGGINGGIVHGETDEFSYNIVKDPVHVRDFQSTILHQFGIEHESFSRNYRGLMSASPAGKKLGWLRRSSPDAVQ